MNHLTVSTALAQMAASMSGASRSSPVGRPKTGTSKNSRTAPKTKPAVMRARK
jgi:hypothetical protein